MHSREESGPAGMPSHADFAVPRMGEAAPDAATARGFEAPKVDTPSGALSHAIPLPDAPARGAGPGLSLSYSSNGGHSLFGYGWSLPISHIGHHMRDGLPRYDGSNRYAIDGGEELVQVPESAAPDAPPWQEVETIAGQSFRIHRFRSRVDSDLAIVERYTRTTDGDVHWRILEPSGSVSVFGQDPAARLAHPAFPARIYRWLLERTYDTSGNVTYFSYKAEDAAGRSGASGINRHLKTVRFGAVAPYDPLTEVLPGFAYNLVFDYGDHPGAAPDIVPSANWSARPDPFSDRRAGFEIATNRLCRRVLLYHDLPELGPSPTLTQALNLKYQMVHGVSRLTQAEPEFFRRDADGYDRSALPPITFGYSPFAHASEPQPLAAVAVTGLPGLREAPMGAERAWADLRGSGLPGILSDDGGTLRFAPNLGGGKFGAAEPLATAPVAGLLSTGRLGIEPIDRDGRVALTLRTPSLRGYFPLDERGAAGAFRSFDSVATSRGPSVHTLDATGDGYADLLDLGDEALLLAEGKGREGMGPFRETGGADRPAVRQAGATRALLLADMTGDGLSDIVEVGPESVIYWPALGHGRFDAPRRMRDVPRLAAPDGFDPARVVLASLSGTGPADVVYFGEDSVIYALNACGHAYAEPHTLPGTGRVGPGAAAQVIDLFGRGVPVLALPATGGAPARVVAPAGPLRPHLLISVANGRGGESRVGYRSSAEMAAESLSEGHQWRGTPPFPVICVTRIEEVDHLRGRTYTRRLSYAHAHFDAEEREFRGFARVDEWDGSEAEEAAGKAPVRPPEAQPLMLTRTWYDTGLPPDHPLSPESLADEWWDGGGADLPWRPSAPELPPSAPPAHLRRARRGAMIRSEVYALDGSSAADVPQTTTTATTGAVCLASPNGARPAVVRGVPECSVSVFWERSVDSPQVSQTVTMATDQQGNVTEAASVSYGRGAPDTTLPPQVRSDQARTLADVSQKYFTNDTMPSGANRRLLRRRSWKSVSWVIEGVAPPQGTLFSGADLKALFDAAPEVDFTASTGIVLTKRQTGESRQRYLADDLATELGEGVLGTLPIVERSYTLTLSAQLRAAVWDADFVTDAHLDAAGYVDLDGDGRWWRPSGRFERGAAARARFLQPGAMTDAVGLRTGIEYDPHALYVIRRSDDLGNEINTEIDYRTGSVIRQIDANGTITEVSLDISGRIIAQALRGPAGEGDSLADPTLTITYDDTSFALIGKPTSRRMRMRDRHADAGARWLERVAYLDGAGALLQGRAEATPGLADTIGAGGQVIETDTGTARRWRVTPKPRLTHKSRAIGGFDPWFATGDAYEDDARLTERGGGSRDRLDAFGRADRTDYADGTFTTSSQTPWRVTAGDQNDNARESLWYQNRGAPDPAAPEPVGDAAHGAWVAARHDGTFSEVHMDAGGATLFEREPLEGGAVQTLRTSRVPGGHLAQVFDSSGREVSATYYDFIGQEMRLRLMEDGESQIFHDAAGRRKWLRQPDGATHEFLHDAIGRPLGVRSTPAGGGTAVIGSLTIYGDGHPEADARNLRTRVLAVLDSSGLTRMRGYEFKGMLAEAEKMYLADPLDVPDYSALLGMGPTQALAAGEALMARERFTSSTSYDAMGRAVQSVTPDGAVLDRALNRDGGLENLRLTPGTGGLTRDVVRGETHDAYGALVRMALGNGTTLAQDFDPEMRRLTRQSVTRDSDGAVLMDVGIERDAVGNITTLRDAAASEIFFANGVADGTQRFEYDALYRLTRATGRELAALSHGPWARETGAPLPHQNNAAAVHRYTRRYSYDINDNLTEIHHSAGGNSWRRRMRYGAGSNRLEAVSAPGDADGVFSLGLSYDERGRLTGGAGLGPLSWSGGGQLRQADLGGGGTAHYIAGACGGRVRKIIDRPGGIRDDWLYLGPVEIYRRSQNGVLQEERRTHKVMAAGRLLMRLETKTIDVADPAAPTAPLWRFRHEDLTGAISVETTETGAVIMHETFHPFGTTAYRSGASAAEVSLARFRHASRETDEESGLVCIGHRYYARWLGRWISSDPAGPVNGPNTYVYCRDNPVMHSDHSGLDSNDDKAVALIKQGPGTWTWEELKWFVAHTGGTMSSRVTEENYQSKWRDGKWHVLADGQGEGEGSSGEAADDAAKDSDEKPPDASENDAKGAEEQTADTPGDTDVNASGKGEGEDKTKPAPGDPAGKTDESGWGVDDVPRNPGATAVSTYNSVQRSKYAKGNVERAKEAVKKIDAAIEAGDEATAWKEAKKASDGRANARTATQNKMKYTGGKQLSDVVDGKRDFAKSKAHYSKGINPEMTPKERVKWNRYTPGLPEHKPGPRTGAWQQATRDIAIGSGKTNRMMSGFSNFGKRAGPIGTALGVLAGIYTYAVAPPEEKTRVGVGEVASFAGGALGFAGGTALAAFAVGFCVSNPVGWVAGAITIGVLAVGALAAWAGSELFKRGATETYDYATGR